MHIATIVARNYLAAARVLARSFAAQHPGGTCWTLVIDDLEHECDDAGEPFRIVRPEQLAIGPWDRLVAGYGVLELSTAVKPWLVRHLLAQPGVERVVYLDPDIQVFDSLAELDELLSEHALVVNPHVTAPMPRDGLRPAETDILLSGAFNLGFAGFAAGAATERLLDWWSERLTTDCLVDPEHGYFVDQRWMDFAPGLVEDLCVLRDPGYNVAYWNLPSRAVRRRGERYEVDGRPLRFFHFSGFDPARPHVLSKHQNRIALAHEPVLAELCTRYAESLAAEGHAEWSAKPYAFDALGDGTPLDAAARQVFRSAAAAGALADERVFAPAGGAAFTAYLNSPAGNGDGGEAGVTRYLAVLHGQRKDLGSAFPDLEGADATRLVAWAQVFGGPTGAVPDALLPLGRGEHDAGGRLLPGVTVAGYFKAVLGVGEHARQLVGALETQGIPVAAITLRPDAAPEHDSLGVRAPAGGAGRGGFAFDLVCVNADATPGVIDQLGDQLAGSYRIGYWAWEVASFPERWLGAFGCLDEVWVGSRHVRDALAPVATVPVIAIPQPVSLPEGARAAQPPPGLPEGFRFLFAFDYLSVFERKNPLALIDAFSHACPAGSGAVLLLKTLNHEHAPVEHARLRALASTHPDIHVLEDRLAPAERDGLMAACDCYVSLHRAEGFGYTLAEAMWLAKPVIATAYSGNLDYMTSENSYLVDHRLVEIGPGHDPYPPAGRWAEPDVEHAARLMRDVLADPEVAARRGRRAAADIRRTHGPAAAGEAMAERLRLLMAAPVRRAGGTSSNGFGALHTDWVADRIRSGPVSAPTQRFGTPQRAARRSLLRLLKPVTVHQRLVDNELLKGLEAVDASVQALALSHAAALRRLEQLSAELERLRADRDGA